MLLGTNTNWRVGGGEGECKRSGVEVPVGQEVMECTSDPGYAVRWEWMVDGQWQYGEQGSLVAWLVGCVGKLDVVFD